MTAAKTYKTEKKGYKNIKRTGVKPLGVNANLLSEDIPKLCVVRSSIDTCDETTLAATFVVGNIFWKYFD